MSTSASETPQTVQRVKVGMTGLALVLLLIGLASAIFSSASKDKSIDVAGGPKADVVANISITNDSVAAGGSEPLAELGVSPSTATPGNQTIIVPPAILTAPPPATPAH